MNTKHETKEPLRYGCDLLTLCLGLGLLALALMACHEAPRDNPFDPKLTPAVELISVEMDTASSTATLEWTPYAGPQPFWAYWVMRKVHGIEGAVLLAEIPDVERTTFQDTTLAPDTEYVYWVAVVNQSGFTQESDPVLDVRYHLPPVELLQAELSSETAMAELAWTRYRGSKFEAYEIHREGGDVGQEVVKELTDVDSTTYTDSLLDGNTTYTYWIAVRTGWGKVVSNKRSGLFYVLDDVRTIPTPVYYPHAVSLAMDEQDQLYVAMTVRSARGVMAGAAYVISLRETEAISSGISFDVPLTSGPPIRLAAGYGKVAVSVLAEDGRIRVAQAGFLQGPSPAPLGDDGG